MVGTAAVQQKVTTLLGLQRYSEAEAIAATLIAENPESSIAWLQMAICRQGLADLPAALTAVNESLKFRQDWQGSWRVRSGIHAGLGKVDEAIADAREAIRLAPEEAVGHLVLAEALRHRVNDLPEAYTVARHAVTLEPTNADAHNSVGVSAFMLGHVDVAEQAFGESLQHDPQSARSRRNLALAVRSHGHSANLVDAAVGFAATLAMAPNLQHARSNLIDTCFSFAARSWWLGLTTLFAGFFAAMILFNVMVDSVRGFAGPAQFLVAVAVAVAVAAPPATICRRLLRRIPASARRGIREVGLRPLGTRIRLAGTALAAVAGVASPLIPQFPVFAIGLAALVASVLIARRPRRE